MKAALGLLLLLTARPTAAQVCTAGATGLSFGTYDPFAPAPTAVTATVTVSCRATVALSFSYAVQLGPGLAGTLARRSMTSGPARLDYQLFTDPARTAVWGDGTAGTVTVTDGYLLAALATINRSYTAYGAIPPLQRVIPGAYADTVTVLVVY